MRREVLQLVIGTGQPGNLLFVVVSVAEELPGDARIYAVFSGEDAFERPDEDAFGTMTREEFSTFCVLARKAHGRERSRLRAGAATSAEPLLSNLRGRPVWPLSETLSEEFSRSLSTSEPFAR